MKENSNARNCKKRKLKFDEYHRRYEIMGNMSTSRCLYDYEQDRKWPSRKETPPDELLTLAHRWELLFSCWWYDSREAQTRQNSLKIRGKNSLRAVLRYTLTGLKSHDHIFTLGYTWKTKKKQEPTSERYKNVFVFQFHRISPAWGLTEISAMDKQ